jgi:hypothetical protein
VPNKAGIQINISDCLDLQHALQKVYKLLSLRVHNLAVNKLWGNRKIIANLKGKGIAAQLIEEAIEEVR